MNTEERLDDEKRLLVEKNMGLIACVLRKLGITRENEDYEDFFSIGSLGLCKAALRFNNCGIITFSTYAFKNIEYELLMEFRSRKRLPKTISNPCTAFENKAVNCEEYELIEKRTAFSQIMNKHRNSFSDGEIKVLYLLLSGRTIRETAKELGCSPAVVYRQKQKATEKFMTFNYSE